MAKTTFSSGVIVTSQWLNGAQQIYFDGQDLDWHYQPLGLNSLVRTGPNGLDSAYVTLGTDQPELDAAGKFLAGLPVSGSKVITGLWNFGYDQNPILGNPANVIANAPKSFTTNDKYNNANGIPSPTIPQKFAALVDADLVTKLTLLDQIENLLESLEVDNGIYYSATNPACQNYSVGGGNSDVICTP
jgi:hypothetical protein